MSPTPSQPEYYKPEQTALLLLDFHTYIFKKYDDPTIHSALQEAAKLKKWAQSHNVEVVHCLIGADQQPFETSKNAAQLTGLLASMKDPDDLSEHTAVREQTLGTERTFTRRLGTISAFRSPGLEEYLRQKGLVSLLLAGVSTSGCLMRTTLSATDLGFVTTVVHDACADPKPGVHDFLVENVLGGHSYASTSVEIEKLLDTAWARK